MFPYSDRITILPIYRFIFFNSSCKRNIVYSAFIITFTISVTHSIKISNIEQIYTYRCMHFYYHQKD